jgi:hypothetical protein
MDPNLNCGTLLNSPPTVSRTSRRHGPQPSSQDNTIIHRVNCLIPANEGCPAFRLTPALPQRMLPEDARRVGVTC